MTITVSLPATEVISVDGMASVNTVIWGAGEHHATIGTTTTDPGRLLVERKAPVCDG